MTDMHLPFNPLLITPARPLPRTIGIIGAGTIGPDIGYYLKSALAGSTLVLIDIDQAALDRALARVVGYADKGLARGKLSADQATDVKERIVASTDYAALHGCDWVIEAATENLALKQRIFRDIEAVVRADAVVTSNTSSIPAQRMFSHLEHPERATVTHFFAPAFRNPAVEVIAWDGAAPDLVPWLRWVFCMTDKVPMVTSDVVCFMLDRIFDNWCNEAGLLLDQATPAQVDFVAGEFVHAGPFFVLNLANGNPIIIETNTLQMEEEGAHYRPADVFANAGRWDTIQPGEPVDLTEDQRHRIRDRLLGVLFSQSFDILDRAIGTPADLELGCRLAFAFKQGPLELARTMGPAEVKRITAQFSAERTGMPQPRQGSDDYQAFYRHVLVDRLDDVCVLTLRRPEALNALHDELTDEILAILQAHENAPGLKGFVITGYGTRAFCAGADIGRFPSLLGNAEESVAYARACSRLLRYLDRCPLPVVAALNGMALGGGFELAIRCHSIVAVHDAWMQLPEVTLGIVPGIGGMVVPYRRWPEAAEVLNEMVLRAERLSAPAALEAGVIDALATDVGELLTLAIARVRATEAGPPRVSVAPVPLTALPEVKSPTVSAEGQPLSLEISRIVQAAIVGAAAADSLEAALEIGYQAFGASALTAAAREGISAFQERRRPDFSSVP